VGIKEVTDTLLEFAQNIDGRFEPSTTLRGMAEGGEVFYP